MEYWVTGAHEEIQSLKYLQVYVLVHQFTVPSDRHTMWGKLICKCKCDNSGMVSHYKVRYVAKGYAQIFGVDFKKTTTPMARLESFRLVLRLVASLNWDFQQFNIKTAFVHGVLLPEEVAYMKQPPSFEESGKEDWVMKLNKSSYGIRQASRI